MCLMPFITGKRTARKKHSNTHVQCSVFSHLCVWNRAETRKPLRGVKLEDTELIYQTETPQLVRQNHRTEWCGLERTNLKDQGAPTPIMWCLSPPNTNHVDQINQSDPLSGTNQPSYKSHPAGNTKHCFHGLNLEPNSEVPHQPNSHCPGQSVLLSMSLQQSEPFSKKKKKNTRCKPESRKHLPSDSNTF